MLGILDVKKLNMLEKLSLARCGFIGAPVLASRLSALDVVLPATDEDRVELADEDAEEK